MGNFTPVIRQAERGDLGLMLQLIRELAEYEHMADQVVATEALMEEWMFERQKTEALIVEANGEAVGYALYFYNFSTFTGRCGIYLEDLYVRPQFRGDGLGRAVLQHLAALALQQGCARLDWQCLDWNEPSIAFYRSVGAVPQEEWTTWRLTGKTLEAMASWRGE